jgi:hypothetical protein
VFDSKSRQPQPPITEHIHMSVWLDKRHFTATQRLLPFRSLLLLLFGRRRQSVLLSYSLITSSLFNSAAHQNKKQSNRTTTAEQALSNCALHLA